MFFRKVTKSSTFALFLLCLVLGGCITPATRQAQAVVAQADSLWHIGQIYGIDEGDSATLAQAYETLKKQSARSDLRQLSEVFPFVPCTSSLCTYAHACYHYGRLLRQKDDPVSAMQVFIDATHSRTRNYHILGRVYSNMGSICHLANEFPLSYDMFSRSADYFQKNGDTLNYYYALNDMAYELAEQGKIDSCFAIVEDIESNNAQNKTLLAYCCLSKAEALLRSSHYDSAIDYAYQSKRYTTSISSVDLLLAQAYSFLSKKDSAVYYAYRVLSSSLSLFEQNNALYIITNDDKTKDLDAVRQTAADRSDTQKLLEIRQGKMSQAVQLLEQDLTRKPDWKWLIGIIVTLIIVCSIISMYVYRKRRQKALLTQEIDVLEQAASTIQEKHDELAERYQTNHRQIEDEINSRCAMLRTNENIKKTLAWKNYKKMCSIVDQRFYFLASKLRNNHSLNETEVRLCILTLLDCEYDRMAELLYRSSTSIGTLKIRVAKKLGTTAKNLRSYLIENECIG